MSKSLGNGVDPIQASNKLGAEIVRLWVASADYSGDIAGDDKIFARVVDAYRRIRNTLRFLLANTSDFDPQRDAVPLSQMFELDRWALAHARQLQTTFLAHYDRYEFHPVVAKLQVYCSEDLGAFYLDVLKDRLYTTPAAGLPRRSAQTALWHITQALLRWMAPFLSFTAEEAWALVGDGQSIFATTYWQWPQQDDAAPLLERWSRIRAVREMVNKQIEALREQGQIGASLQAEVDVYAPPTEFALLSPLGDDLRFVFITSRATLHTAQDELRIVVTPTAHAKCERCWHWRADVGTDAAHPGLCARCVSNLYGAGEPRHIA